MRKLVLFAEKSLSGRTIILPLTEIGKQTDVVLI